LAAQFIALNYEKAQLDTSHYKNSPFQYFRLYSQGTDGAVQSLKLINGASDEMKLELQENYTSILATKSGRFDVGVVFAGFGITAPEIGYDDYANVDVKGKCIVVLRHAPSVFSGPKSKELQEHLFIRTKIKNANKHGARAIIFCSDLKEIRRVQKIAKSEQMHEPLLKVELTANRGEDEMPAVHCHRSVVDEFLSKAEFDIDKVEQQIVETNKPASVEFSNLTVQASVAKIRLGQKLKNVVGLLPGKGPLANETIVLGAHYDHLGRGGWGSLSIGANHAIHNGADDNASGTTVLLEVARQLSARKEPLKRSVLFIAFSGEELGLLGSKRYVRDPIVPITDTIAMLNLDMVGRLREQQLTVYGTGTAQLWPGLLEQAAAPHKIEIIPRRGGYGPSDHASFYERGVPVLHFFTGFHPQYHRPSDDIELLNIEGMRQITSMLVSMIESVASAEHRPKRSVAADNVAQGSSVSINQLLANGPARNVSNNALLGIVPVEEKGIIRIEQVVKGSGAALAGLRIGDEIVVLGADRVKSQKHLIELVRAKKRGDKVTIQVRRNGILLELDVTL
jgi:Zn-dependent M28 family amino/carboxypeptidase